MASHLFIDNSFFFVEGYKHALKECGQPKNCKPQLNYPKAKDYFDKKCNGDIRRRVIVGSALSGNIITSLQRNSFEVFTLPKYPDLRTGKNRERGVDHKLIWEIGKTVFSERRDSSHIRIILCTGDKDFLPIFPDLLTAGCSLDVYVWAGTYSRQYKDQVDSSGGKIYELNEDWKKFIDIIKIIQPS